VLSVKEIAIRHCERVVYSVSGKKRLLLGKKAVFSVWRRSFSGGEGGLFGQKGVAFRKKKVKEPMKRGGTMRRGWRGSAEAGR